MWLLLCLLDFEGVSQIMVWHVDTDLQAGFWLWILHLHFERWFLVQQAGFNLSMQDFGSPCWILAFNVWFWLKMEDFDSLYLWFRLLDLNWC